MLKKIIHSFISHRHPWRSVQFDELAEIYTSMSMRSLAFSLVGIFVPVFLYDKGVDVQTIFFFFGVFFLLRVPVSYIAGYIIARIGPKHSIAVSNLLFIAFLGLLISYETVGWPLMIIAIFYTLANGLFFVAYNTDFSKIKHQDHGGKELGWLFTFERLGSALGPIVGGVIATVFAPEYTLVFAIAVFLASLIPLFMTNEPVKVHQKITFKGFPLRKHTRDFISLSSFNIVNVANGLWWPFFLGVVVFSEGAYAKIGFIIGLSLGVSIVSAKMFGKFIDSKKGGALLHYGTGMQVLLNAIRAGINNFGGALAASVLGEPIALGYRMPIIKGFYDAADSEEGYRIVYLVWAEMITGLAKSAYCFALGFAMYFTAAETTLRYSFIIVGLVGLLMLTQRFPALKRV